MRACWLNWVGRDWSISADYIWLNYSDANIQRFDPVFNHAILRVFAKTLTIKPLTRTGKLLERLTG